MFVIRTFSSALIYRGFILMFGSRRNVKFVLMSRSHLGKYVSFVFIASHMLGRLLINAALVVVAVDTTFVLLIC